jgi:hypothetical protein
MSDPENSTREAQPRPDPNEKLVKIFDTEQESEAMIVKGLLDSAGIDSDMTAASLVQDMFPGLGGIIIRVREEDEPIARRTIEENRQAVPASDSENDDDETQEIKAVVE